MGDLTDKHQSTMKSTSTSPSHLTRKVLYLTPPVLLTVLFYLHLETLTLFFTVQCASRLGNGGDGAREHLREAPTRGHQHPERHLRASRPRRGTFSFRPPPRRAASSALAAPSRRDGTKNAYALAWPGALPRGSELRPGLALLSETFYDHSNLWHGLTSLVPLVSWHARRGCGPAPAKWAFFHHGEVRSGMSGWLMSLAEAATGAPVVVEEFGTAPVCFEEAVVFRRNLAGMSTERLLEAFDFIRCKARAQCGVVDASGIGNETTNLRVTILFRTGGRSFKDEAGVERVFRKECTRVAGPSCVLTVAHSDNLTFCDQVRLLSRTDVFISAHGAQMTNLVFMDRNSSIMEFYPMGWRQRAAGGQFVFRWMASRAGMRVLPANPQSSEPNGVEAASGGRTVRVPVDGEPRGDAARGSWWDPAGDPCPDGTLDIFSCYKNRRIGMDEAAFSEFASRVFTANKERKSAKARRGQEPGANCKCS
uniref:Glycosyltransferase 61 catalytic domain-containing protein n=1 Tax=Aegilops tauschii TaxID=37682 RepID=M8BDV7_AEGTA